ncbi:hypothetical protein ACP70R_038038 [Stipagrostis hirtigluma subsp. patula]
MDWTGLPEDLLIEFAVRLTVVDWLRFRAVCTAWRQATDTASGSGRRPKREPPWLMLPGSGADPTTATFFSFLDGRRRTTGPLPEPAIQSRIWIGSAYGWLVTADAECTLHLLNPVTGAQLPLPPITTMGHHELLPRTESNDAARFLFHERSFMAVHGHGVLYAREHYEITMDKMPLCFLRKAVPLCDPSSGKYFVMMIHGPHYKLAFARQGDAKWVTLPSLYLFEDIIPYRGQFYAVTQCGTVLIWEPDGTTFKSRIIVPGLIEDEDYIYFKQYLAESLDGDLVLTWRKYQSCINYEEEPDNSASESEDDSQDDNTEYCPEPDPTVRFQVFVLHEGCHGNEWKELHSLGGAALFIGYNSAVFLSTDGIPGLPPDCIYFTDDLISNAWRRKEEPRDMGVFDMKDKKIIPMPSVAQDSKNWPPHVWVTPTILTTASDFLDTHHRKILPN